MAELLDFLFQEKSCERMLMLALILAEFADKVQPFNDRYRFTH
jgi:hypothetical protein